MSFLKYPEYKDSGVEWLGEVPSHWKVDRLKRSILSCNNGVWGEDSQGDENDIPCVRVADFDRQRLLVILSEPTIRNVPLKDRKKRLLTIGNLLIEKSGGGEKQPVGCVVLYADQKTSVCSNFIARIELAHNMDPSFWRYIHAAAYAIRLTTGSINQTSGIQNLDQERYFNERAVFPSLSEQTAISFFLDRETAKIDALISEQQKLIELLKEKRQAVISHAVTKGLDPNAKMKDSGVEWLGMVPEDWEVVPLKKYVFQIESGTSVNSIDTPAEADELGILKTSCVYTGEFNPQENKTILIEEYDRVSCPLKENTLIVSRMNTPELVGAAGLVGAFISNIFLPDRLWQISFRNVNISFVYYWTLSNIYRAQVKMACAGTSSSMQNLSQDQLRGFVLPSPSVKEQNNIVEHLESELETISMLTKEALCATELLQERRTVLISAAVTGKIDVRGIINR